MQPKLATYEFGETTIYETHRGLLRKSAAAEPRLEDVFNPDPIVLALHLQSTINVEAEKRLRRIEERESLSYELLHNLTLEVTRLGIEAHNLKMRVESLQSRLDFDERRSRSLESVVEYRPPSGGRPQGARPGGPPAQQTAAPCAGPGAGDWQHPGVQAAATAQPAPGSETGPSLAATGIGTRHRRWQRTPAATRRRRRPGATMAGAQGAPWSREGAGGIRTRPRPGAANDGGGAGDGDDDDSPDSADATES